jgi:hypothetical protein
MGRRRPHSEIMRLALVLFCLVSAFAQAAEEVKTIAVSPSVNLEFTAEKVDPGIKRELTESGYVMHQGKLYFSHTAPPDLVLTSGQITIDGKRIALDVSGLANAWVSGDRIYRRFVRLDRHFEKQGVLTLSVVFAKGGAEDYLVEWAIVSGQSMRLRIMNCGDTYPDWVSPAAEVRK